jgi:hypothetical protein
VRLAQDYFIEKKFFFKTFGSGLNLPAGGFQWSGCTRKTEAYYFLF